MDELIKSYLSRIDDALDGAPDESFDDLSDEITRGLVGVMPGIRRYRGQSVHVDTQSPVTEQDLRVLRTRLLIFQRDGYKDRSATRNVPQVTASATSTSSATASVSISVAFGELSRAIDRSDLHEGEKAMLRDKAMELESTARKGDAQSLCEKLSDALDLAKRAPDTAQAMVTILGILATLFGQG